MKIKNYLFFLKKYKDDICKFILLILSLFYILVRIHYFRSTKAGMYLGNWNIGNLEFYGFIFILMSCVFFILLYDKPRRYLYIIVGFLAGYWLSLTPVTYPF